MSQTLLQAHWFLKAQINKIPPKIFMPLLDTILLTSYVQTTTNSKLAPAIENSGINI